MKENDSRWFVAIQYLDVKPEEKLFGPDSLSLELDGGPYGKEGFPSKEEAKIHQDTIIKEWPEDGRPARSMVISITKVKE